MKTSRYYWGTRHKGESKISRLQEENICLKKCVETLRKDNAACQEKISGLERILDNQTRVIERISAERDHAQSRLAATTAELIKTEQLNREQENWKEKYFELKAKAAEQDRKYKELKKKLNIRDGNEGPFGIAGSPSSNRPFRADSTEENRKKKGGARYGHRGYVRRSETAVKRDFPDLPENAVIRIGDFIHHSLTSAAKNGMAEIIVGCMPGKLFKYACGEQNTHAHQSKLTPSRLREFGIELSGVDLEKIDTMGELAANLSPEVYQTVLEKLYPIAKKQLQDWAGESSVTLVLYDDTGKKLIG